MSDSGPREARAIAVDWSGDRRAPQRRIWVAEARRGELLSLTGGLDREAAVAHVVALAAAGPVVAGFDFAFSWPAWRLRELGCGSAPGLWERAAADGEAWLAACAPPLWGRPGRRRPARGPERPELRATDLLGPGRPGSPFQIGGAGAVGTGSLRGMPLLPRLREAGFALWPWDDASAATALEIYPRALTGAVVKSSALARAAHLAAEPRVPAALATVAGAGEDAFDAAVSAVVMAEHLDALLGLRAAADEATRLEGAIWRPALSA